MKLIALFFLILSLAQLSGCASYYASRPNYNHIIDKWLEQHEYTKIEASLKKLSKDHPDYKNISSRKKIIGQKKQAYIDRALASAKHQQSIEEWQTALDLYNTALKKIEGNKKISTARNKFIKERDTQIIELRKNMLLRRARALVQYKPIYKKLKMLIPNDNIARHDINKYENERNEASNHLNDCGKHALREKNYTLAEECLELSNQLVTSKKTAELITKAKGIIKQNNDKKKVLELIQSYHDAYEGGNFPKARLHLDQLLVIDPQHEKSIQLKEQLDRDINTRIEKGINLGKILYSEGKINAALKIWQESSTFDPKNEELSTLIHRAKKVSLKLETLEKSPAK